MHTAQTAGSWPEARVLELKCLWSDGLSAARIAKVLGGVSRNAVIGKVHRLGLAGRPTPSPPAGRRPTTPTRAARAASTPKPPPPPRPPSAPQAARRPRHAEVAQASGPYAPLWLLGPGACRWPIGDPRGAGFGFCGAPTVRRPYCDDHRGRAYRAAPGRADRSASPARRRGVG
ncbi:GcrA family cell cycle regulator [Caulobacter sp.]|uniref:GcrA family cell cycle regulator n=1 Tax=Caulobacter sp. TaxID=78 RepID=UPI001B083459|nr:GcrA family cell cycle regulator [Caulobacter sp.]MBO9546962.1 GcrA cell cycle regulator [Caulobacter sp.]